MVAPFQLVAVHIDNVLAIAEIPSEEDRRLVNDVVRVAASFSGTRPAWHAFNWPQQTGVGDLDAASRAFSGFLKARVEAVAPDHLLLFGARPLLLLFGESDPRPPEEHLGVQLSCFADAPTLRREPECKRALWQRISNQRR